MVLLKNVFFQKDLSPKTDKKELIYKMRQYLDRNNDYSLLNNSILLDYYNRILEKTDKEIDYF